MIAARDRHGESLGPSVFRNDLQYFGAGCRQFSTSPQLRPGERPMTLLQSGDHRIAQDHSGAGIKLVPGVRPADGIENSPLQCREINLAACKCIG